MPRQLIGWSMAGSRLIIDVSTLIRSEGHATGISRVSYELSRWALKHRQDARLAAIDWVYDYGTFRILNPASAAGLLQKKVVIDTFLVPDRWRADKILESASTCRFRSATARQAPHRTAMPHSAFIDRSTRATACRLLRRLATARPCSPQTAER